jgi:hypothetical protein
MNYEFERIRNEALGVRSTYRCDSRLKELTKTKEILSHDSHYSAEIRTEHLPNIRLEPHRYTNLLGIVTAKSML